MPREPPVRPYEACPLCGGMSAPLGSIGCTQHPMWVEGLPTELTWCECPDCGHVHTDGYHDADELDLMLSGTAEGQRPGHDIEGGRYTWAPTVEAVAHHIPPPARWLDVGFGSGSAMFVAAEFGFDVSGIDLRRSTVDDMAAIGYAVECVDLKDHVGVFDIITMFDVLEHMPHPRASLGHVDRLMAPGGVLVVSAPNADCEAWRFLTAAGANPYWHEIEHYHNFTRGRLTALLADAGFDVVSYRVSNRFRLGMELVARKT
jgi:protein O-GlcNAc transferase